MGNEDRIRKWRAAKGTEPTEPPADVTGTPGTPLPPPPGTRIPTRREEQLADEARLREDIADSRLPGEDDIDREVASDTERRRTHARAMRQRLLLFVGLPILLVGAYNYLDMAPKGRDEDGLDFTMSWLRHHDRYEDQVTASRDCCGAREDAA